MDICRGSANGHKRHRRRKEKRGYIILSFFLTLIDSVPQEVACYVKDVMGVCRVGASGSYLSAGPQSRSSSFVSTCLFLVPLLALQHFKLQASRPQYLSILCYVTRLQGPSTADDASDRHYAFQCLVSSSQTSAHFGSALRAKSTLDAGSQMDRVDHDRPC